METAAKSIKSAAKEAKKRLKSRFWEDYKKELENGVKKAESEGVAASGVEASVMGSAVYRIPEKERNAEIIRMKEVGIK